MAIKYPGSTGIGIGYGKAQVYDFSKISEGAQKVAASFRTKKKSTKDSSDKLLKALSDVDISKVRNADVPWFTEEFNSILEDQQKYMMTGASVDGLHNVPLLKRIAQYKHKVAQSVMAKDNYDKMINQYRTNQDDYGNEDNELGLAGQHETPMFLGQDYNPAWIGTEESSEDVVVEGGYRRGDIVEGTQIDPENVRENREMRAGKKDYFKIYNNLVKAQERGRKLNEEELAELEEAANAIQNDDQLWDSEAGAFRHNVDQTETVTTEAIPGAGNFRLNPNLKIEEHFKKIADNLNATEITRTVGGKYSLGSGTNVQYFDELSQVGEAQLEAAVDQVLQTHNYPDELKAELQKIAGEGGDVREFVKEKLRGMTSESKGIQAIQRPPSYIQVGEKREAASGQSLAPETYQYHGQRRDENGNMVVVEGIKYSTQVIGTEGEDDFRQGHRFDFGGKSMDIRPGEAGFMVLEKGTGEGASNPGYYTESRNIKFIPNAIAFYHTAKEDVSVVINGIQQTYKKGEMLDDDAVANMEAEDYVILPWLEGKNDDGMTISIGFNQSVHDAFASWASATPKDKEVYRNIISSTGIDPARVAQSRIKKDE